MRKNKLLFFICLSLLTAPIALAVEVTLDVIQQFNTSAGLDHQIHFADFNGDGNNDMIARFSDDGFKIGVWLHDGEKFSDSVDCIIDLSNTVKLTTVQKINTNAGWDHQIHFADANGDGTLDLFARLVVDDVPAVGLWLNEDGVFSDSADCIIKAGLIGDCWFNVGDFNDDGYADVAMMSQYGSYHAPKVVFGRTDWPAAIDAADLVCQYPVDDDYTQLGNYTSVITGDFNGDGIDDFLYPDQGTKTSTGDYGGRSVIYFGRSDMDGTPDVVLSYDGARAVALNDSQSVFLRWYALMPSVGDFNGDGYEDIFTGAYLSYTNIFLTSEASGEVEQMLNTGAGVVYLGGPDFDDIPDVIMVAPDEILKHTTVGEYMWMGYRVYNAGDVTGNGTDDMSIPGWYWDFNLIYPGDVSYTQAETIDDAVILRDPAWYYTKERYTVGSYTDQHGANLVPVGDINGDGFADLGNTRNYYGNGPDDPGIRFFFGSSGKSGMVLPDLESSKFSKVQPSFIDLDGDGKSEMVMHDAEGLLNIVKLEIVTPSDQTWFNAGDYNNDGYADVAIMSQYGSYHAPKIVFGREVVPALISSADIDCEYPVDDDYTQLGNYTSVITGDFNGDGIDDFLYPDQGTKTSTGDYGGRSVIYFGRSDMDGTPDVVLSYDGARAVALNDSQSVFLRWYALMPSVGDFNGDGYEDIFTGAYLSYTNIFLTSEASGEVEQMLNTGAGVVYLGGPDFDDIPDVIMVAPDEILKHTTVGEYMWMGYRVYNAGDVTGNGTDDMSIPGWYWDFNLIYPGDVSYTQAETIDDAVILRDPAWYYTKERYTVGSYTDQHGANLVPVGDVNGDGLADLGNTRNYYGNGPDDPGIRLFFGSSGKSGMVLPDFESMDYISIQPSNIDFDGDGNADFVAHDAEGLLTLVKVTATDVSVKDNEQLIPLTYSLAQNYPNPFNPVTTIAYEIPKAGDVSLKVYNLQGKLVMTLVDNYESAGVKLVMMNAGHLASGIYFYRLETSDFSDIKKLVLLK